MKTTKPAKQKPKPKREKPIALNMPFDEAMKRLIRVSPPPKKK